MGGNSSMPLFVNGKRMDGRKPGELRAIKMTTGVLNKADGSALVEWGRNKVLAAVYGPRECFPKHQADPYRAVVRARYLMAPFSSLEEHGRSGPNRRSIEISKVIRSVFENVVITENYPKAAIDIFIEVLQGHGSTRCVGITAAALALANAGIPMRDIPLAISTGKIEGEVVVDLQKEEDNYGQSDMAIAMRPRNGEILLLQMDGKLTRAEVKKAFDMAFAVVPDVQSLQTNALTAAYGKASAAALENDQE